MSSPNGNRRQHFVDDDDRAWLNQRIEDGKISVQDLADRIGLTRQAVYYILSGRTKRVWNWPAIVEAVGGTPPSGIPLVLDDKLREIVRRWPELSDADKATIEALAKRLSRTKP